MDGVDLDSTETDASLIERIVRARHFSCSGCGQRREVQMVHWMFCPHVEPMQASWHLRRGGSDGAAFLSVPVGGSHVFCAPCRQLLKSDILPSDGIEQVCAGCAMDWLLEVGESSYCAS